jgi:chorismate mutase
LIESFEKRALISQKIGILKQKGGNPVRDSERELQVIKERSRWLKDPTLNHEAEAFMRAVISGSRRLQHAENYKLDLDIAFKDSPDYDKTVAYQGIPGSYGEQAALYFIKGDEKKLISVNYFEDVFKKVSENVGQIRSGHNIHQHLDLIAGLPLEGYDSFLSSFNDVYRLGPDQLQLGFLKVLKGSLMEEETKRYGIVSQAFPPYEVLKTDSLDYPQLLSLKGICKMTEIYYNSRQFENSIRFLEHFFDSPVKLYEELSLFYERTGQDLTAHSRIRRYEILLDFYQKKAEGLFREEDIKAYEQVFKEILVLDLYIREDLKSRPPLAGEPVKYKDIREGLEAAGLDKDNTHIEHFRYDVFTGAATGKVIKKDLLAAFDYGKRDPLSRSAAVIVLDWRETLDENYKKRTGADEPHLRCTEPGIRRGI